MFWFWIWIFSLTFIYTLRRVLWLSPQECVVTHLPRSKHGTEQTRVLTSGIFVLYPIVEQVQTICWSSCEYTEQGWVYKKKPTHRISLSSKQYVVSDICHTCSDDVSVKVQLSIQYHVDLQQAAYAVKHSDPVQVLATASRQCVGEYIQTHTVDEVMKQWSELAKVVMTLLKKRMEKEQLGLCLDRVHMLRIDGFVDDDNDDHHHMMRQLKKLQAWKKKYPQYSDTALALLILSSSSSSSHTHDDMM